MPFLGLDIGGANLKAADGHGWARSATFALWRQPAGLTEALRSLLHDRFPLDQLAVTMTGELCDCFADKREGVLSILGALEPLLDPSRILVWRNDGYFLPLEQARANPLAAAAANWLALAFLAGRSTSAYPSALLIDIGSTTTDIIPLRSGRPVPRGRTDPERLRRGELVYTGVRRTPLCALLGPEKPFVAAELFSTTWDVYLVLGQIAESPATDTADGRPATRAAAHDRLARMLCADRETSSEDERLELARLAASRQRLLIRRGLERVLGDLEETPSCVVLAGEGEFLAREIVHECLPAATPISLSQTLGPEVSRAACAHAVAVLAEAESGGDEGS
jgi:probable H4MPT-linked C1 transfer pathway protein